jgi:hypothetical protein
LGQLEVKLTKFTANDYFATGGQLWGFNWQNQGQNRKKIEVLGSIIGAIKSNLKKED